jgi:type II secretion system protein G
MKKSKGFTLIELLVVIAIIGLLATIVLVSVSSSRQKAKDARRVSDLRQISLALELYAEDNGRLYPDGGDGGAGCNDWGAATRPLTAIQQPAYISTLPIDPDMTLALCNVASPPDTCYFYESDGSDYVLRARLTRSSDRSLVTDIDGTVFGCTCTDANPYYYCLQP